MKSSFARCSGEVIDTDEVGGSPSSSAAISSSRRRAAPFSRPPATSAA
ncbi:MAG TPA: hypothetical protein VFS00_16500 [Polyangiaceae bacterium]|nr:hypothetical protein [Polyangiaceae bacterium]